MKIALLLIILFSGQLIAQYDTLNKFNSHGKKHGYWIQYLDTNLNPTDSTHAKFKSFAYYENGKLRLGQYYDSRRKDTRLVTDVDTSKSDVFISGTLSLYFPKTNDIFYESTYSEGNIILIKEYSYTNRNGERIWDIIYTWDFSKAHGNAPGSHFGEDFFNPKVYASPNSKKYWKIKKGKKWRIIKVKNN